MLVALCDELVSLIWSLLKLFSLAGLMINSSGRCSSRLRRRRNQSPVNTVCELALKPLFQKETKYWKSLVKSPSIKLAITRPIEQRFCAKANHRVYSNPGMLLGVQNKDFGANSQMVFTGSWFFLLAQAIVLQAKPLKLEKGVCQSYLFFEIVPACKNVFSLP